MALAIPDQAASLRRLMTDEAGALGLIDGTPSRTPPAGAQENLRCPCSSRSVENTVLERRPAAGRVFAIASGKGGVGKTNIAANLAIRLSQIGLRVVLVDADLGTANLDVIFNVTSAFDLSHVLRGERDLERIIVHVSPRLRLIAGASGLLLADQPRSSDLSRIVTALDGLLADCDIMLVDCGAGISEAVLAIAEAVDELLLVTTPEPTALTDAYALTKVLSRSASRPCVRLIVNLARDRREAGAVAERFGAVAARFLGMPVDCVGQILHDPCVGDSVRRRLPLIHAHPNCPAASGISALASRLASPRGNADPTPGFFRRLTRYFC